MDFFEGCALMIALYRETGVKLRGHGDNIFMSKERKSKDNTKIYQMNINSK
jgi:hypothetical protein